MGEHQFRILFVLTPALHPNAGGVQMSTCKLARHFVSRGDQVAVFSFAESGHSEDEPMQLIHPSESGGQNNTINLDQLREATQKLKPDIVINQMPYEHEIGQLLKCEKDYLLLGCLRNTLYSVRGNLESYVARTAPGPLKPLSGSSLLQKAFLVLHRKRQRADLERILETYDHFVMFGPPNLEELRYFVPDFDRDKVRLIPNSIPEVAAAPPRKQKRMLWLGRVSHEQKRADLILPIWKQVSQALPDWELDVVGDGPLLEELKQHAGEMGLQRIHFHGRQVPDEFYRRAAIFFMTSAFEGFPNTLVEAQSHAAVPVIFDSYPVASWLVRDGVNGALVPPFDTGTMADQIIELAESPDRERFAKQALESARRFHIDRVGQLWQELFEAEVSKHVSQQDIEPAA